MGQTDGMSEPEAGSLAAQLFHLMAALGALGVFVCGASLDLYYLARGRAGRRIWKRAERRLSQTRWGTPEAMAVLGVLFVLYLPAAFSVASSGPAAEAGLPPSVNALALQPLLFHLLPLLLVLALFRVRGYPFQPPAMGYRAAAGKGLLYGLAMFPPTLLVSFLSTQALQWANVPIVRQPVIEWLASQQAGMVQRLILVFLAMFAAPLTEEVLFRGILLPVVCRHVGLAPAVLMVSLLFALVHAHLPSALPLTFMGAGLAAGYALTGNLVTPIVMHSILNTTNILALFAASGSAPP